MAIDSINREVWLSADGQTWEPRPAVWPTVGYLLAPPGVAMGRSTIMILGELEEDADGNNWEQVLAVGTIEP